MKINIYAQCLIRILVKQSGTSRKTMMQKVTEKRDIRHDQAIEMK